jgi:hypothetical protein
MSLDDRILQSIERLGPSTAESIAADVEHDLLDVRLRLGLMLGCRVAVSARVWRLLDLSLTARLSNMADSVCGLVRGLSAQAGV